MRILLILLFLLIVLPACQPQATDDEIDRMCDRLLVLRKAEGDQEMKKKCVAEAMGEGTTQRQALCRTGAVNKLEYWNRCRLGEPRPSPPNPSPGTGRGE